MKIALPESSKFVEVAVHSILKFRSALQGLGVLLLLVCAANARADVISSWDFSATLDQPIDGSTSVTGSFTLDQTKSTVTAFDFSIPGGTVSAANGWAAFTADFAATSPLGTVGVLDFRDGIASSLYLVFDSSIPKFNGDFYYAGVNLSSANIIASQLACGGDALCGAGDSRVSDFSSGTATLAPPAPPASAAEPGTLALFGLGVIGLALLQWGKRKRDVLL
jgi:hypothetical protein